MSALRQLVVALWLALVACGAAQADVWGFVDDEGVAHFASERFDPRYELFFRGDERFDAANPITAPVDLPRAVAVPTAPPKLLAFFDVSPSYKAVKHLLREAASTHGIEYELLQALIVTESGFDARAVSPRGAVGLMQVMPATGQRYGLKADAKSTVEQQLADPRTNIRAGSRYLRDLLRKYPDRLELVLAAYNAGEGAVQRAGYQVPNYRETQDYVKTVLQLYTLLRPPPAITALRGASASGRVRVEFSASPATGAPVGGARGRGNMVPSVGTAALETAPIP